MSEAAYIGRADSKAAVCERTVTTYGLIMNIPLQLLVGLLVIAVILHDHLGDSESMAWCQTMTTLYFVISLLVAVVAYGMTLQEWRNCADYVNGRGWFPALNYAHWIALVLVVPVYFVQSSHLAKNETIGLSLLLVALNLLLSVTMSAHLRSYRNYTPSLGAGITRWVVVGLMALLLESAACAPYVAGGTNTQRLVAASVVGATALSVALAIIGVMRRASPHGRSIQRVQTQFSQCMKRAEQMCMQCAVKEEGCGS